MNSRQKKIIKHLYSYYHNIWIDTWLFYKLLYLLLIKYGKLLTNNDKQI